MRIIHIKVTTAIACLLATSAVALAGPPSPLRPGSQVWDKPGVFDYAKQGAVIAGDMSTQAGTVGKGVMEAMKAMKEWEALTAADKRLEPNYQPPGAPAVPSKCLEQKACRPCYHKAYGDVNATRRNLEKVRAHYDYTYRFTTKGKAFMQGVANAAGGVAAMGAVVEVDKVDDALLEFDKVVRKKNAELLGKLEKNLREVAVCEAKFYKNDDWFDRYGYTYYQFMISQYSYATKN